MSVLTRLYTGTEAEKLFINYIANIYAVSLKKETQLRRSKA